MRRLDESVLDSLRNELATRFTGLSAGGSPNVDAFVDLIIDHVTKWAVANPCDALPWDDYADESTQTRPVYIRRPLDKTVQDQA
jgi:hypothetical protein